MKFTIFYQAIFLVATFCTALHGNATKQTIHVINGLQSPLQCTHTIPEQTEAKINIILRKLNPSPDILHKAILNDSAAEVRQAVNAGTDVNGEKDGKLHLVWAILLKKYNAAEELLKLGASPNVSYRELPLLTATIIGRDAKAALLLVKNGADITYRDNEAPDMKILLGLLQELIKHGYNPNHIWREMDWCAIGTTIFAHEEVLKLFIKNRVNVNQSIPIPNYRGCSWTPLLIAIKLGNKKAVEILLNNKANINQKGTPSGQEAIPGLSGEHTPLSLAVALGKLEIADLLIQRGASI